MPPPSPAGRGCRGVGRASDADTRLSRCDRVNGPAHWPGGSASSHCDAAEQSPIDLCGATPHAHALPNLTFAAGYGAAHTYKFSADGQAYLDAAGLGLILDAGNLVRPFPYTLPYTRSLDDTHRRGCSQQQCVGSYRVYCCQRAPETDRASGMAGAAQSSVVARQEHQLEAGAGPLPLVRWRPAPLWAPVRV